MLPILAAILAFVTIGGLGWALVGGDDSSTAALKRAQGLGQRSPANAKKLAAAAASNTTIFLRDIFVTITWVQHFIRRICCRLIIIAVVFCIRGRCRCRCFICWDGRYGRL